MATVGLVLNSLKPAKLFENSISPPTEKDLFKWYQI